MLYSCISIIAHLYSSCANLSKELSYFQKIVKSIDKILELWDSSNQQLADFKFLQNLTNTDIQ